MLIEFTVENFRSFREQATLSMLSTTDSSHIENTWNDPILKDNSLLSSAVITGANATGKSNLIFALALLRNFVTLSHQHQKGMKLNYQPFAFDGNSNKKPTTFTITFIHEEIKYFYLLSYNDNNIVKEELYHYPKGRKALIFSRTGQGFEFIMDATEQEVISRRTLENSLYLSTSVLFNYKGTMPAYEWFLNRLIVMEMTDPNLLIEVLVEKMNKDAGFKSRVEKAMQMADLGITGVKGKTRLVPYDELSGKFSPQIIGMMTMGGGRLKETDIKMIHGIKNPSGEITSYELNINLESEGTRRLFTIIGPIIESLIYGGTIVIDELDSKLHNSISSWIVFLFHDKNQNTKGAQLIFNTHNQEMLDLGRFRRDQIWFTEKDPDNGTSSLYSLHEFGERKDRDIKKAYQLGRYGSTPFIKDDKVV